MHTHHRPIDNDPHPRILYGFGPAMLMSPPSPRHHIGQAARLTSHISSRDVSAGYNRPPHGPSARPNDRIQGAITREIAAGKWRSPYALCAA